MFTLSILEEIKLSMFSGEGKQVGSPALNDEVSLRVTIVIYILLDISLESSFFSSLENVAMNLSENIHITIMVDNSIIPCALSYSAILQLLDLS